MKQKLMNVWQNMKQRCYNTKNPNYESYGGRGILVCAEWLDKSEPFIEWALANGYNENTSLDRIDNDKGYTPDNCRWTTHQIQTRNVRTLCKANTSGYKGVSYCKHLNKFRSSIMVNLQTISLGVWSTALEAAKAYDFYVLKNGLDHSINNVLIENEYIDIDKHRLLNANNTSGFRGVSKRKDKWTVRIYFNGKYKSLGIFPTALEAAIAREHFIINNKLELQLNKVLNGTDTTTTKSN